MKKENFIPESLIQRKTLIAESATAEDILAQINTVLSQSEFQDRSSTAQIGSAFGLEGSEPLTEEETTSLTQVQIDAAVSSLQSTNTLISDTATGMNKNGKAALGRAEYKVTDAISDIQSANVESATSLLNEAIDELDNAPGGNSIHFRDDIATAISTIQSVIDDINA